jgi:phage-related protein
LSAAAVEAYALSSGIWDGAGTMTESQKVQARYGALMEQTSKTQGDFAGTSDELANAQRIAAAEFENSQAKLGDGLRPVMKNLTDFANDFLIPAFNNTLDAFKDIGTWAENNSAWLTPLVSGILGMVGAVQLMNLWSLITAAGGLPMLITQVLMFNYALLTSPITYIILAIGILVAAIVLLAMNWEAVTKFLGEAWQNFVDWSHDSMKEFGNFFRDMIEGIGKFLTFIWDSIVNYFRGQLALFIYNWESFWTNVGNTATALWTGITDAIMNAWKAVSDWFKTALKNFGDGWNKTWEGLGNFVGDVFRNIVAFVKAPLNAIIDLINGAIGAINSIKVAIPDWVPLLGGQTLGFNIPKIPKLAAGGFVTSPTTALIGEAGPEVVTPLRDFERMMGLDGARGATVNYYAAPNNSLDAEQALFAAMKRAKVLAGW